MGNSRYTLIGLLGFTLFVRGAMLIATPWSLRADPDNYRGLAENLLEHGTFGFKDRPSAFRPPLYPLALSACLAAGPSNRAAIGLLHLILGTATVWLVFRMVDRRGSRSVAIWAGALTACDPILLWQSTLVMTETMAAFLATLAVTLLIEAAEHPAWRRALGAGLCLGMAILCRPTFLPFALAAGVVVLLPVPLTPIGWPARLKLLGVAAAGLAVALLPWAVRNQIELGRPVVTTTHGGYTLLLGNNPYFYEYLRSGPWGVAWNVEDLERARRVSAIGRPPLGELQADSLAYEEARENIRREPAMFAYACLVRVGRLWSLLPHQITLVESAFRRGLRYGVGLWYLLELPLAVFGAVCWVRGRQQAGWLWWLLLALCFTAVHALYWTDMRMRAPLMPGVAMAAAIGAATIVGRFRSPRG